MAKNVIQRVLADNIVRITLGVILIGYGLYLFSLQPLNNIKVIGGLISIGLGISLLAGYKG